nr:protein aar2 like [Quercus suber]
MDPDTALELVKQGATLLLLDVPQYTLLGIDTQVIVRRWDQLQERLVKVLEEEEERYCQAVKSLEFDRQLGPYNLSQYGDWKHLSNYITKSIIERIEPIGGEITVACESGIGTNTPKTAMEKALDEQMKSSKFLTSLDNSQSRRCYYTSIPHVIKQKGIHGQELTSLNIDKTQLLESLLIKDYGGSEDVLLGELICIYCIFGFLQWKALVNLLFGCIEAPFLTRTQLFTKFIKVIYYQLKFGLEKDRTDTSGAATGLSALLDDSWLSTDSFLHHLCKDFFSLMLDASSVDGHLLLWTRKLKELLENNLRWEFQLNNAVDGIYFAEDDEFAPVVEMLDDPSCN